MKGSAYDFLRAPAPTRTRPPTMAATPTQEGTARFSSTEALSPPTSTSVSEVVTLRPRINMYTPSAATRIPARTRPFMSDPCCRSAETDRPGVGKLPEPADCARETP